MPLSEAGELQARRVGERLARESLAAVYSSPRERAQRTAEAVARAAGLDVRIAAGLDEVDFGDWTGCSFAELAGDPGWDDWNARRGGACPPAGETMAAAAQRIVDEIERVAAAQAGGAVALVSHCDMIRAAVAHYLGLPLDHLLRFDIDPASITRLLVGSWGARVAALNETVQQ